MLAKMVDFVIVHATIIGPTLLLLLLIWSRSFRTGVAFLLRTVARPMLLIAVVALVYDGTRTLAGGSGFVVTSLVEHWQGFAPHSLEALRTMVTRTVHPQVWESAVLRLLKLPAWLVVGAIGMFLAWIGRKRHHVNVFIN